MDEVSSRGCHTSKAFHTILLELAISALSAVFGQASCERCLRHGVDSGECPLPFELFPGSGFTESTTKSTEARIEIRKSTLSLFRRPHEELLVLLVVALLEHQTE